MKKCADIKNTVKAACQWIVRAIAALSATVVVLDYLEISFQDIARAITGMIALLSSLIL